MSLVLKPNRSPSDYVLDNLTTTTRNGLTVAFSLKTLSQNYTNPVVKLRHSVTGATKDFYANTSGDLGDTYGATGTSPLNWLGTNNNAIYLANEANLINSTPATNYLTSSYTFPTVFSVAFWVNFSSFLPGGGRSIVFFTYIASSLTTNAIYIAVNGTSIRAAFYPGTNTIDYNTTISLDNWYHITIIYNSGNLSLYVNGEYKGNKNGTFVQSGFILGTGATNNAQCFAGYISDFRIYNRVLTSPEIQYLAGILSYPAPGITNMTIYLPFQSSTSDLSGNNVTITTTGSLSYVTGPTIRALATVDTWYDQSGNGRNATQSTVGNQPVLIKRTNGYVISFDANALKYLSYGLTGTSSIWNNTNYTALIKEQRSSDKGNNYIHGTTIQAANQNLALGYRTNSLFTHAQWVNDYNYTVNGFLIYDTTNTYPTISTYTTGTPILSIDSPYTVPEGSFGFDGIIGKYITINTTALTSGFSWWSTGGSTIECWVKYLTFTNAARASIVPLLFGNMNIATTSANWTFGATSSGTLTFYYWNGTTVNVTTTSTIPLNRWTHIAMSCDATNIRLFINGILSAGPTAISGTPTRSDNFTIGQHNTLSPYAYISNLRIVTGAALYTSSFTPSTTTQLTPASSGTTLILLRVPININRWQLSHHKTDVPGKRIYLNGGQVITNSDNTSISSPGQATLGRGWTSPTHYTGDLYDFLGFNISLPVSDPSAVTILDNYLNYSTRIPRIRTTGASTQKAICIPSGNVFGGISPSILSGCVGAYSARRLIQSYNGPIFRLRRDADNAEADVWADYEGNIERAVDLSLDDGATSGGTITYDGAYRIHTFTTNGTFTATSACVCDLLVVGGGGAGGISTTNYNPSGGGGGGEVYYKTNLYQSANTYTVTVGAGGIAANGGNSSFGLILAKGGGKGGNTRLNGDSGGSGGGGARFSPGAQSTRALGKGNNGGSSAGILGISAGGGGGGGAIQAGQDAVNGDYGNRGGEGLSCAINGSNIVYGSGGGGGRRREFVSGLGGTNAGNSGLPGSNAVPYRGGGGGGADADLVDTTGVYPIPGGEGGSGIVIVRTLRHQGNQGRNAVIQWLGSSTATVTKWYDQSGNVNHVTNIRGNPRISLYPNDTYMYGSFNDGMRFPSAILPSTYTLLHTAQYTSDFKLSNWTITGFTGGSIWLIQGSSGDFNYYELGHGGATFSSSLSLGTYLISVPTSVIATNLTLYVDAYIMRTGPVAANYGALFIDFLDNTQNVVGSSVSFNYTNATLNIWINSTGNVTVPTTTAYIRVRFGINYNETIRLRKDTLLTIKNSGGATVKQWYMGETNKRIFDGVTSDWASGFLNGYAGMTTHSSSNLNPTPANGAVITSLNGWTGYGVGGSPGPILDRSTEIPHISLNGTSTTVGDYFNFGSTTWNFATSGGFTFIGMVRIDGFYNFERIFEFGDGGNYINLNLNGTASSFVLGFAIWINGTNYYNGSAVTLNLNQWYIIANQIKYISPTSFSVSTWVNNTKSSTTHTASLSDFAYNYTYIGRSTGSYSDISIRELLFYNQALTDTQVTSLYNYMNNKFNVLSIPWLEPPITPYLRFQPYYAYQSSPQPFLATYPTTNTVITSINGATGYGVGGNPGPLYDISTGIPHISLNGTSASVGDYFNYENTAWSVGSSNGFTFIGMVRFNNSLRTFERIFEFFQTAGTSSNTLALCRESTTTTLRFDVGNNSGTLNLLRMTNGIVNNTWQIFSCRLQNTGIDTWQIDMWKDNVKTSGTPFTAILGDRTLTSYLGRSSWNGDHYAYIDYRELNFYNQALPDSQINILYQYMNNKYNNQTIPWFSTPPITPYLQFNPFSLFQNLYSTNLIVSVDQNSPNLYRANGNLYNSTSYNTSNTQLSINYGASGEYSDWIVKDVVVFNNTLSTSNISYIENALMKRRLGILDQIAPSTKATSVAAYSFRLLTVTYMGPCVKVRRSTDNVEKDFYASTTGDLGEFYLGRGQSLKEWLNGATGYVRTWYDQTGRGKHVEQTTTASQPTVVLSNTQGNGVYFNNQSLIGPNVFDTSTISNMHVVAASREIGRTNNVLFNLNGPSTGNSMVSAFMPWSDGAWYSNFGSIAPNRAVSPSDITTVSQKAIFSGFKSSADVKNGFRINKGPRYLSSSTTAATVSGGINLGLITSFPPNHHLYTLIVFNTKLNTSEELFIENNIAPFN